MEVKSFSVATSTVSSYGTTATEEKIESKEVVLDQLQKSVEEEIGTSTEPSFSSIKEKIDGLNKFLDANFTSLKFNLHEETERYYVEVVDQETKKVIKEIPSKEFLDMVGNLIEYMGILFDKKI